MKSSKSMQSWKWLKLHAYLILIGTLFWWFYSVATCWSQKDVNEVTVNHFRYFESLPDSKNDLRSVDSIKIVKFFAKNTFHLCIRNQSRYYKSLEKIWKNKLKFKITLA